MKVKELTMWYFLAQMPPPIMATPIGAILMVTFVSCCESVKEVVWGYEPRGEVKSVQPQEDPHAEDEGLYRPYIPSPGK